MQRLGFGMAIAGRWLYIVEGATDVSTDASTFGYLTSFERSRPLAEAP